MAGLRAGYTQQQKTPTMQHEKANAQTRTMHAQSNNIAEHLKVTSMATQVSTQRVELGRSATWPPSTAEAKKLPTPTILINGESFEDDLELFPDLHFLSPVTAEELYGWDSDDDADDDGGEWSAGITDFALFSSDRKRAMETGKPLDPKWDSFVSNQAEAFERSCDRVRESVPELTPDASPELRDDLSSEEDEEVEVKAGKTAVTRLQVPDYLTEEVRPWDSGVMIGPEDELPMAFIMPRAKRVERPGLRHTRTLSGRRHVWRAPGRDMPTLGEDAEAEAEAEKESE